MDRKGSYMRPTNRASAPTSLFTVEVETRNRALRSNHLTVAKVFDNAAMTHSVWRRGKWSVCQTGIANTPEGVREWMRLHALKGRVNWVVSGNAANTLTLLRWWEYAEASGFVYVSRTHGRPNLPVGHASTDAIYADTLVAGHRTTVIGYTQSGIRWRWVSGNQYIPSGDPSAVHSSISGRARGVGDTEGGFGSDRTVERSSLRWSDWFRKLCIFWRSRANGPFGATVGALAVSMLRSHVPARLLCTHSDSDVHTLERSAAFGGRASVWFVGTVRHSSDREPLPAKDGTGKISPSITGPIHHIDVRSMYPSLLRDRAYPVKLLSYSENCKASEVFELAAQIGVIAEVEIITRVPEYPRRVGERVTYPVGRFVTYLTGPELLKLKDDGEIVACSRMAVYKMGRPFERAADALIGMRQESDAIGSRDDSQFAKLLANSLGGKLAQRSGGWTRHADLDTPGEWGEQWAYDNRSGIRSRLKYLCGLCWRWDNDQTGKGPYTFAFAYLCAYGRLMMRQWREVLPERTVVSQDTDGMWVTDPAIEWLASANEPQGCDAGTLRLTDRSERARFWGPRHYRVDSGWTLAGFSSPVVSDDETTIRDVHEQSLSVRGMDGPPAETISHARTSQLTLSEVGGYVGEDGWVLAQHVGRAGPAERAD